MADQAEDDKPTNTPEYGCHTNPFPPAEEPAPTKKGAAPAPDAAQE